MGCLNSWKTNVEPFKISCRTCGVSKEEPKNQAESKEPLEEILTVCVCAVTPINHWPLNPFFYLELRGSVWFPCPCFVEDADQHGRRIIQGTIWGSCEEQQVAFSEDIFLSPWIRLLWDRMRVRELGTVCIDRKPLFDREKEKDIELAWCAL